MSILEKRDVYKPFEYPQAREFALLQQQAHWIETEVPMIGDISDWKNRLSDSEKNVIGNILKGFAQTETVVNDYWTNLVTKWFPKPEIIAMGVTFGSMEIIHAEAYSLLNESLGLDDFEAFLEDEATANKIESLMEVRDTEVTPDNLPAIARSLAIFSAFTEGVNLFSSFAVLMSFQLRNLLKGVGQIVAFSVRDESLHSKGGVWLFNQLVKENPEIFTESLKNDIYEAARLCIKLEDEFIEKTFELGDIENISAKQLKNFIRHRANLKLNELNLDSIFEADMDLVAEMEWFDHLTAGKEQQDFFANRVTTYSKGNTNWGDAFDEGDDNFF